MDLVLHLAGRNLSFVARAAVELRPLNECVRVSVANHRAANLTAKALWMESMVASNHNRTRHQLAAFLAALAELPPVVILAEQQPVLLEVEVRAVH